MADPRRRRPIDARPVRGELLHHAEEPEVVEPESPDSVIREVPMLADPLPPPRAPAMPVRAFAAGRYRLIQAVRYAATVVEVLLALRFLLKVFGASVQTPFVALVNGVSAPLVAPFQDIFPVVGQGPFVLEPASLVAILIYPLLAWGAVSLVRFLSARRTIAIWR